LEKQIYIYKYVTNNTYNFFGNADLQMDDVIFVHEHMVEHDNC